MTKIANSGKSDKNDKKINNGKNKSGENATEIIGKIDWLN